MNSKNQKRLGFIIILLGLIVLVFDQFTLIPIWIIGIGSIIVILSFLKFKNATFYVIAFLLIYYPISIVRDAFMKEYKLDLVIPNEKRTYYIATYRSYFEWRDYFFTWFTPNLIKLDFTDDNVIYMNRYMPLHIAYNRDDLRKKGYTTIRTSRNSYSYIIFVPLNKAQQLQHEKQRYWDRKLIYRVIDTKIDSIEMVR